MKSAGIILVLFYQKAPPCLLIKKYVMKSFRSLTVACMFIAIAFASCSPSLKVTSDYDKTANFRQYKTFALDTFRASQSLSQLNKDRIANAVKAEMVKKGFTESTVPDMLVHISAIFEKQKSVSSTTDYYGY